MDKGGLGTARGWGGQQDKRERGSLHTSMCSQCCWLWATAAVIGHARHQVSRKLRADTGTCPITACTSPQPTALLPAHLMTLSHVTVMTRKSRNKMPTRHPGSSVKLGPAKAHGDMGAWQRQSVTVYAAARYGVCPRASHVIKGFGMRSAVRPHAAHAWQATAAPAAPAAACRGQRSPVNWAIPGPQRA